MSIKKVKGLFMLSSLIILSALQAHANIESNLTKKSINTAHFTVAPVPIKGTVLDETNLPLPGVTVKTKDGKATVITDINGRFSIDAETDQTLVFSFVGYVNQELKVTPGKMMAVIMQKQNNDLNEVIVVGYGTQKKVNLSGAVSQVSGAVLEDRPLTTVGSGLQGVLPNLQITQGNAPGQGASFNIRGFTSINGNNNGNGSPLILVDGVQEDPNLINPNDVASVSVLKDAAAAAIYGGRAAFGVVLITTKSGKKNQKPLLNLTTSYTSNQVSVLPKYMNSLDYINYMDNASINAGGSAYFSQRIRTAVTAYFNDPVHNPSAIMIQP